MMLSFKRIYLSAILLIFGCASGAVLGETLLRVTNLVNPFMSRYSLETAVDVYSSHPFLNHTLTPNLSFVRPAHTFPNIPAYYLATNNLGFRFDAARFSKKDGNAFRIAVLGDSLIEGYQIEYSLPYLLEQRLRGITGSDRIEAMNWGVMSYSPIIHYINLRRNILRFKPDLVILHFDMTDVFDDNHRYKDITELDAQGNPVSVKPGVEYATLNQDGKPVSLLARSRELALKKPLGSAAGFKIFLIEKSPLPHIKIYTKR